MNIQARIAQHEPVTGESQFARDVLTGLTARPKRLSPKYFTTRPDRICLSRSLSFPNIIRRVANSRSLQSTRLKWRACCPKIRR